MGQERPVRVSGDLQLFVVQLARDRLALGLMDSPSQELIQSRDLAGEH